MFSFVRAYHINFTSVGFDPAIKLITWLSSTWRCIKHAPTLSDCLRGMLKIRINLYFFPLLCSSLGSVPLVTKSGTYIKFMGRSAFGDGLDELLPLGGGPPTKSKSLKTTVFPLRWCLAKLFLKSESKIPIRIDRCEFLCLTQPPTMRLWGPTLMRKRFGQTTINGTERSGAKGRFGIRPVFFQFWKVGPTFELDRMGGRTLSSKTFGAS